MLELKNKVKVAVETMASSDVERFMRVERSKSQKPLNKIPESAGFSVKKILKVLQDRFSHTGDISHEIEGMIEDQVEMRTRELFLKANYDALTHLPNRSYFHSSLEQLVTKAKGVEGEFTLLFLDLDGFKNVNDIYGHHVGDELLRNVSARLISTVREEDVVYRLGGDEFVVLLAGLSDREVTKSICERMITEVSRSYWIEQIDINISTSIGVARYPQDAKTSSELIENSDKALYASKHSGRSTYRFYNDIVLDTELLEDSLVQQLEVAIQAGKVLACFEPQVDLSNHKVIGSSVTAIWMNSDIEGSYLASWLDTLNQSSWSQSVGAWLIDSGLYYLQQWQEVNAELVVSVPVIEAIWKNNNLVEFMNNRMALYRVGVAQVQLEFMLEAVMTGELQDALNALSEAGYQITLTEIGEVPLDLALLSKIRVQKIKLGKAWLQAAMCSETNQKWLRAIIEMAKILDICVIATGVEMEEQVELLRACGCLTGQGSQWSPPLGGDEFYKGLAAQNLVLH